VTDHFRYRKILPDGRILRTKVSHGKMQYGAQLWGHIWKTQLALQSPDQFWECLEKRRPVDRQLAAPSRKLPRPERLPAGLVVSLTKVVGLDESAVLAMTINEAETRWQEFLRGLAEGDGEELTEPD
jgi:hypothetical protein